MGETEQPRRKFLKYSAIGLAIAAGAGVLCSNRLKPADNSPFGQAKAFDAVRQKYLDNILSDKDKYGVPGWDSFESLVYDPVFEKSDQEFIRRGVTKQKEAVAGYSPASGMVRWMITPYFGEKGVKLATYVGKSAFDDFEREDDLLSALDHESFHAQVIHTGNIHFKMSQPRGKAMSNFIFNLMSEVCGFEKQFFYVENGRRKPSSRILSRCIKTAKPIYSQLEQVALQQTTEGAFARGVIEAIQSRPTYKYFL